MRKIIGFILALFLLGLLANLKNVLDPNIFALLLNIFPDYFLSDHSRTMGNIEALWNIIFLIISVLLSIKLYLYISQNNNKPDGSSNCSKDED